jgi:chemotaxis protein CheX
MSNANFLEFSKPFIDAAKNVFETMVFTKLEPGRPSVKQGNTSKGDVSAIIGLSGEVSKDGENKKYRAMLVMSFPYDTYIKVAGAMLMETYTEFNEEIRDVGGEICNMIMGNAKRDLAGIGYTTDMAIPSIIEGPGHTIKYPEKTTVIIIPIKSAHGDMFIELCYAEGE